MFQMRNDYEYINKAASICVVCTREGEKYLDTFHLSSLSVIVEDVCEANPMVDLLLFLEDNYVKVASDRGLSIRDLYDALMKTCKDSLRWDAPYTYEMFVEAVTKEYVGVRKVIWDDSSFRCFLSSLLDHIPEGASGQFTPNSSGELVVYSGSQILLQKRFTKSGPFYDPWMFHTS